MREWDTGHFPPACRGAQTAGSAGRVATPNEDGCETLERFCNSIWKAERRGQAQAFAKIIKRVTKAGLVHCRQAHVVEGRRSSSGVIELPEECEAVTAQRIGPLEPALGQSESAEVEQGDGVLALCAELAKDGAALLVE